MKEVAAFDEDKTVMTNISSNYIAIHYPKYSTHAMFTISNMQEYIVGVLVHPNEELSVLYEICENDFMLRKILPKLQEENILARIVE